MVWYFIGVTYIHTYFIYYRINRTLHGRLEIGNFSSSVEKYFSTVGDKFSYLRAAM